MTTSINLMHFNVHNKDFNTRLCQHERFIHSDDHIKDIDTHTHTHTQSVLWNVDSGGITNGERGYSLFVLSCSVLLRIDSLGPSHEGTYRCAFNGVSSQAVVLDIASKLFNTMSCSW